MGCAWLGAREGALLGILAMLAGFAMLTTLHDRQWELTLEMALTGVGFGFNLTASADLMSRAVPHSQIGEATGILSMMRTSGGSVGSQVAATVITATSVAGAEYPSDHGYTVAFAIGTGAALLCLFAVLLVPRGRAQ